jgi:OsmC-like protein
MVHVRPVTGKKLLGSAGRHTVVTDRKVAEGGTDTGCTSGELLLLAMASCATGSIRNALAKRALATDNMRVEVEFAPPNSPAARDGILITVFLPGQILTAGTEPIVAAATAGGVVSRIQLGSDLEVRCRPIESSPNPPQA